MNYDTPEILRIIASDAQLSAADRGALRQAADELDASYTQLMIDLEQLTAMRMHYRAAQERIFELSRWSTSTGVVAITARFAK